MTEKTVIVTGGSRGLGLAICRRYVAAGATVMTCGHSEVEVPAPIHYMSCDVRGPQASADTVQAVAARFGSVDVVVWQAPRLQGELQLIQRLRTRAEPVAAQASKLVLQLLDEEVTALQLGLERLDLGVARGPGSGPAQRVEGSRKTPTTTCLLQAELSASENPVRPNKRRK